MEGARSEDKRRRDEAFPGPGCHETALRRYIILAALRLHPPLSCDPPSSFLPPPPSPTPSTVSCSFPARSHHHVANEIVSHRSNRRLTLGTFREQHKRTAFFSIFSPPLPHTHHCPLLHAPLCPNFMRLISSGELDIGVRVVRV